jgi:hypothetical protein
VVMLVGQKRGGGSSRGECPAGPIFKFASIAIGRAITASTIEPRGMVTPANVTSSRAYLCVESGPRYDIEFIGSRRLRNPPERPSNKSRHPKISVPVYHQFKRFLDKLVKNS